MKKRGKTPDHQYAVLNQLKHLQKYSDLHNPEAIRQFIADKKGKNSYKQKLAWAYETFAQFYKIQWQMPTFTKQEQMPKLPTEEQLDKFIAASGEILSLKLWLSKETGIRPTELQELQVRDIDTEHNAINPTTAKNGSPRILTIPPNLTKSLTQHIIKYRLNPNDKLFKGTAKKYGDAFRQMRRKLAKRTNDPSLMTIRLYDFRHWFATMRYIKYRDVPLTADDMGHRDYNTTRKYLHLAKIMQMIKDDEWICKTAENITQATELIQHGFEYITEMEGLKIFRKRK
ncbi:MAG TPA: site-specific integrase [Patescibacteria group bacterium]|nr:site-specific integrase [Patescibacteria group bacterium]